MHARGRGFEVCGTRSRGTGLGLVTFDLATDRIADCVPRDFWRPDTIVIVAAVITQMDRCLTDPVRSRLINVTNTMRLLDDVRALGARPVFISSCYVFDGAYGYYTESDPISPANEYGRHKAEVEQYLADWPEALVARLDKVVGDDPRGTHLLAYWYRDYLEGKPMRCIAGSLLSPTYVKDVAAALLTAAETGLAGTYHVANPEFFRRDELARHFCRALGVPEKVLAVPVEEFGFPDRRALKTYLDGSRFSAATGLRFTPMREVFASFRRHLHVRGPDGPCQGSAIRPRL